MHLKKLLFPWRLDNRVADNDHKKAGLHFELNGAARVNNGGTMTRRDASGKGGVMDPDSAERQGSFYWATKGGQWGDKYWTCALTPGRSGATDELAGRMTVACRTKELFVHALPV